MRDYNQEYVEELQRLQKGDHCRDGCYTMGPPLGDDELRAEALAVARHLRSPQGPHGYVSALLVALAERLEKRNRDVEDHRGERDHWFNRFRELEGACFDAVAALQPTKKKDNAQKENE